MTNPLVEITLTKTQQKLLLDIDILELEHRQIIRLPIRRGDKMIINLDAFELEQLCGYVAPFAGYVEDRKKSNKYNDLFRYLHRYLDEYDEKYDY